METWKYIALILLALLSANPTMAQDEDDELEYNSFDAPKKFDWSKAFIGGNLGLGFTQNEVLVDISPNFGYFLTDRFAPGVGLTYTYYNAKAYSDYRSTVLGSRVFARYYIFDQIFAHAEYEVLHIKLSYNELGSRVTDSGYVSGLLVGGGFHQRFGTSNSGLVVMMLFNVFDNKLSPYSNPIFRMGFIVGL